VPDLKCSHKLGHQPVFPRLAVQVRSRNFCELLPLKYDGTCFVGGLGRFEMAGALPDRHRRRRRTSGFGESLNPAGRPSFFCRWMTSESFSAECAPTSPSANGRRIVPRSPWWCRPGQLSARAQPWGPASLNGTSSLVAPRRQQAREEGNSGPRIPSAGATRYRERPGFASGAKTFCVVAVEPWDCAPMVTVVRSAPPASVVATILSEDLPFNNSMDHSEKTRLDHTRLGAGAANSGPANAQTLCRSSSFQTSTRDGFPRSAPIHLARGPHPGRPGGFSRASSGNSVERKTGPSPLAACMRFDDQTRRSVAESPRAKNHPLWNPAPRPGGAKMAFQIENRRAFPGVPAPRSTEL